MSAHNNNNNGQTNNEQKEQEVEAAVDRAYLQGGDSPRDGRLPTTTTQDFVTVHLPAPYSSSYVKILRGIYGARVSNKIFDDDHTALLLSLSYVQFEGDL